MFDPQMELLSTVLEEVVGALESGEGDTAWGRARATMTACEENEKTEADLSAAVAACDLPALKALLAGWVSGERLSTLHDRGVLKRAMKAYRKSLKITRLDAESSLGGGVFSSGRESSIAGVRPPERYPRAVWDELARQGKLIDVKFGMYELGPKA
jgi:hypothetical protein